MNPLRGKSHQSKPGERPGGGGVIEKDEKKMKEDGTGEGRRSV